MKKLTANQTSMVERARSDYSQFHADNLSVLFAAHKLWRWEDEGLVAHACPLHPEGDCYTLMLTKNLEGGQDA